MSTEQAAAPWLALGRAVMRHPNRANDCPWWKEFASRIAENGFSPVPVLPHQKKPRFNKWQNACYARPDPDFTRRHGLKHGRDSIGIACGRIRSGEEGIGWLFAVDCDADDPTVSRELECITVEQFGETPLLRVGQQPRWLRLYRSPTPVGSAKAPRRLELLGAGRQVVAFGYHPCTGGPYEWPPDKQPCRDRGRGPTPCRGSPAHGLSGGAGLAE